MKKNELGEQLTELLDVYLAWGRTQIRAVAPHVTDGEAREACRQLREWEQEAVRLRRRFEQALR